MKFLDWIKKHKIDLIIVLALFLIALGIRAQTHDSFTDIYGFDSIWDARMAKYIITQEYPGWPFSSYDDLRIDTPWGRSDVNANQPGWWGLEAMVYWALGGTSNFNYALFGKVASWLVAIVGSLAIPAVYLFGKETYSRLTGLAAALFLAVSSNHLYYSIYGHAENDALGLTLFFMCLYTFVLAVKKRDWKYSALSLLMFTWTSITWQSYPVACLLVSGTTAAYMTIAFFLKKFNHYQENEEKKQERRWMINTLLWISLSGLVIFYFIGNTTFAAAGASPLVLSAIYCIAIEYLMSKEKSVRKKLETTVGTKAAVAAAALFILFTASYGVNMITAPIDYTFGTALATGGGKSTLLGYEQRMQETIAEQNPISGSTFLDRITTLSGNFGISIWLALISIIIIVAKLFTMPFSRKDFTYKWDIMAAAFIFLSLWTLTEKAITTFFLSAAVALGAGYFFGFAEKLIKASAKKMKGYDKPTMAVLFLFLTASFLSGTAVAIQSVQNFGYDIPDEWFQTFSFLNTVPKDSIVTAWWDYGHWMNYFSGDNIKVSLDNIQDRRDIIYTVASAFTHTTNCSYDPSTTSYACDSTAEALEQAELESLSLLKPLKTNYTLIDKEIVAGSTGGKFGALEHIANDNVGCMQEFTCYDVTNGNVACYVGSASVNGQMVSAGYMFSAADWLNLTSTTWPGTAGDMPIYNLDTGAQIGSLGSRYFAKTMNYSGKVLYSSALSCGSDFFSGYASASSPVLYSFEQRLFFNDASLKHVTKVYDDGWNVIYKVNWNGVEDPEDFNKWTQQHSVLCTGMAEEKCAASDYKG